MSKVSNNHSLRSALQPSASKCMNPCKTCVISLWFPSNGSKRAPSPGGERFPSGLVPGEGATGQRRTVQTLPADMGNLAVHFLALAGSLFPS